MAAPHTAAHLTALVASLIVLAGGLWLLTRPLTSLVVLILAATAGLVLWAGQTLTSTGPLAGSARLSRPGRVLIALGVAVLGIVTLVWFISSLWIPPWVPALAAAVLMARSLWSAARNSTPHSSPSRPVRIRHLLLAGSWAILAAVAWYWSGLAMVVTGAVFALRAVIFGVTGTFAAVGVLRGAPRAAERTQRAEHTERTGTVHREHRPWVSWAAALTVVALAMSAGWLSATLRSSIQVPDAFYDPPAELPRDQGALIRSEVWPGTPPEGGAVHRILHATTDAHGEPAVASGVVVLPDPMPPGPRPVVLWAHGTTGIARTCAPSLIGDMFEMDGIPAVQEALARGWVIVATDYPGHGAPGDFPYLIGEGEGRSTLDSAIAAAQLPGVELSDDVVIWGHSQGGHSALWAGALAREYTPEVTVHGIAAISPAADPHALAERILEASDLGSTLSVIVSWVVLPYAQTYQDVHVEDYVAAPARSLLEEISQRCVTESGLLISLLTGFALTWDRPIFQTDLKGSALERRLEQNRAQGPWPAPLLMAWGSEDEVIHPQLQHDYLDWLCDTGVDVTWQEYPDYQHMTIVEEDSDFIPVLAQWTQDRFETRPGADRSPPEGFQSAPPLLGCG